MLKGMPCVPKFAGIKDVANLTGSAHKEASRQAFLRRLFPGLLRRLRARHSGMVWVAAILHCALAILEPQLPAFHRRNAALVHVGRCLKGRRLPVVTGRTGDAEIPLEARKLVPVAVAQWKLPQETLVRVSKLALGPRCPLCMVKRSA